MCVRNGYIITRGEQLSETYIRKDRKIQDDVI